jgi:hypothetical protein
MYAARESAAQRASAAAAAIRNFFIRALFLAGPFAMPCPPGTAEKEAASLELFPLFFVGPRAAVQGL